MNSSLKNEFPPVIASQTMQEVLSIADKFAESESPVLITGETGTGKDLVARYIHAKSIRAKGPFVHLNCSAIPIELAENEFFGHSKGAFTGAGNDSRGAFQAAQGGILFLDEVGDMSYVLQGKLLRVLQEKEFSRLGDTRIVKADVRIIAATNQSLEEAMGEKRFRKDLFYRLNALHLHIPPLRERREDIPLLIEYFAKQCSRPLQFSKEALALLQNFSWPGNVREVKNLLEGLSALYQCEITPKEVLDLLERRSGIFMEPPKEDDTFSAFIQERFNGKALKQIQREITRDAIVWALEKAQSGRGVRNNAARILGINVKTLFRLRKKYNL